MSAEQVMEIMKEAMLVALHGGKEPLTADEYLKLLEHYHIESSVEYFGTKE